MEQIFNYYESKKVGKNSIMPFNLYLPEKAKEIELKLENFVGKILIDDKKPIIVTNKLTQTTLKKLEDIMTTSGWHNILFIYESQEECIIRADLVAKIDMDVNKTLDQTKSFKEEAIDDLKQELLILKQKKQRALDSNNNSDYKLLINNYKQVLELILELEKPKTVSQTWTVQGLDYVDKFINNGLDSTIKGHYHKTNSVDIDDIMQKVSNKVKEELKKSGLGL